MAMQPLICKSVITKRGLNTAVDLRFFEGYERCRFPASAEKGSVKPDYCAVLKT